MTTTARAALAVVVLALAGPVYGAALDVRLLSAFDSSELGRWSVDELFPGRDTRFVRSGIQPDESAPPIEVFLDVSLLELDRDVAKVSLHARVRPLGDDTAVEWASRKFTLGRGEEASFPVGANPLVHVWIAHYGSLAAPRLSPEVPVVKMATTFLIWERTEDELRLVTRKRVRLAGPEPIEVVLEGAGDGGAELKVRLAPQSRDEDGAILDLGVDTVDYSLGVRTVRTDRLRLGWNDAVRVAGFRSPAGEVFVEIKPER